MGKKIVSLLLLITLFMCSCNEKNEPNGGENNSIDFVIKIVNENDYNIFNDTRIRSILSHLITVTYEGKEYLVTTSDDEAALSSDPVSLRISSDKEGNYFLLFGGIDGTKNVKNASIKVNFTDGEKREITFSNTKEDSKTYKRNYAYNGTAQENNEFQIKIPLVKYKNNTGNLTSYSFDFFFKDQNGNNLLTNEKFVLQLIEGSSLNYRGHTYKIAPKDQNNKSFQWILSKPNDIYYLYFGQLESNYYYKNQEITINWFDGSNDILNFTLIDGGGYTDDIREISINGEIINPIKFSVTLHCLELHINKTFNWND